jgi:hypothetical protein
MYNLSALLLVCLIVLERETTRPLIGTRLPADPAIAACKQDAPEGDGGEECGAKSAESEGEDTSLGPEGVAVESVYGVEDRGDGERGDCVGSFRVGC